MCNLEDAKQRTTSVIRRATRIWFHVSNTSALLPQQQPQKLQQLIFYCGSYSHRILLFVIQICRMTKKKTLKCISNKWVPRRHRSSLQMEKWSIKEQHRCSLDPQLLSVTAYPGYCVSHFSLFSIYAPEF